MKPRRKPWSLRTVIGAISLGSVAPLLALSAVGLLALSRAYEARGADRVRHELLEHATSRFLSALVDQDVALRSYLAEGRPQTLERLQRSLTVERDAWSHVRADAGDEFARPLDAVAESVAVWHHSIVEPQLARVGAVPPADAAAIARAATRQFEEVRARYAHLAAEIRTRGDTVLAAHASAIARIHAVMLALGVVALALALFLTRYLLRHTAAPLAELARRAEAHEPFARPADGAAVREIHALAASLHELDGKVQAREQALAAAHDEAVALSRFGAHVQQLAQEDELLAAYVRSCEDLLTPSRTHVLARNASGNRLDVVWPEMPLDEQVRHPILGEPMRCRAVRTLREVTADAGAPTACACDLGVPQTGSYLCLPMLAAGELIGVTNLQSEETDYFSPERIQRIQGYTGFASATLSSVRMIAATRDRALRDGLTGAYNRAFLAEYMAKTLAAARRRGVSLAVLMCDLDHFKRINDEHGHLAGDHAIIATTRCLQAQTRTTDAVVRYGGEEFVVLVVDVDADTALATAERIRIAIERTRVMHEAMDLGSILRISIGVAIFPQHGGDDHALLVAADTALYRAKAAGRNRVELAAAPGAENV